MDKAELVELAKQLRKPDGRKGIEAAEFMNETNNPMIADTIDTLKLVPYHGVLELGYGNGDHVPYVLEQAVGVSYAGLDISKTMFEEAKKRNAASCESGQASFGLYDGQNMPFDDGVFDRMFTVNTIYFWADVPGLLNELCRVLKPSGFASIAFVQKEFMKTLPFTDYGFEFFDQQMIVELVGQSDFGSVEIVDRTDKVTSKSGETVERHYSIATVTK